jgi:hypothetical protein
MSASQSIECPICMECIELNKNCLTTECGHQFHTSCLMKSVTHNGFGCPYCRTKMAEEPEDDDESTEYEYVDGEDDSDDDEVLDPLDDNDNLRGFRMFFENIEGHEHDQDDVEEEIANEATLLREQEEALEQANDPSIPTISYITDKLKEHVVTYSELVQAMLVSHEEFSHSEEFNHSDDRIFGLIRSIVSNFNPADVEEIPVPPVPAPIVRQRSVNSEAQTREQVKKNYVQNIQSCIDIFV